MKPSKCCSGFHQSPKEVDNQTRAPKFPGMCTHWPINLEYLMETLAMIEDSCSVVPVWAFWGYKARQWNCFLSDLNVPMKIRSQDHWVGLLPIGCSHLFINIYKEHRPDKEGSGNPSVGDERKDKTRFLDLDSPALHPANDNTWSFVKRVIEVGTSCIPIPFASSFTNPCRLPMSSGNFFRSEQPERV